MGTTEYIILGLVILISLFAAGFLVWHFAFRKQGNTQGEACTANDQWAAKHYCGGDGKCQRGTSGGASGTTCETSSQCMFGLTCTADKCSSSVTPPDNNIGSFKDSNITVENNGKTQYLTLFPGSSSESGLSGWEDTVPNHSFTYNSSTNEMTVSGDQTGALFINSFGAIETGTASKFFFVKQTSGDIRLEDGFANPIKIEDANSGSGEGEGAIFIDPSRYISQSLDTKGSNTFVKIVKA